MEGLNSNLNLNADASPRVVPGIGEWGPDGVPTTRRKRRMRWWVSIALVVSLAAVVGLGAWVWLQLR